MLDALLDQRKQCLIALDVYPKTSKDYGIALDNLTKIEKLILLHTQPQPVSTPLDKFGISAESLLNVGANILGIVLVMNHERGANLLNKTALGMVRRLK